MNSASKKRKYRSKVDRDFMAFVRWLPCFLCFRELYEFFDKEPWALVEMIANELIPEDRQKSPTEAAHRDCQLQGAGYRRSSRFVSAARSATDIISPSGTRTTRERRRSGSGRGSIGTGLLV